MVRWLGNQERRTLPSFVLQFSASLLSQPKTRLLPGCLQSKNTFSSHLLQHNPLFTKLCNKQPLIQHAKIDRTTWKQVHRACPGLSFIQINRLHSTIFPLWKFLTEQSYVLLVSNRQSVGGQSRDCVDHSRRFVCGSVPCPTDDCVSSAVVLGAWYMVHGVRGIVCDTWYLVIERVRKCPVAITGHLHLLIDLARPC